MAYERVLFDLDGTLTESGPGITHAVQYALHQMGIDEPDRSKLEVFVGPPLNVSFQERYGMSSEESGRAIHYFRDVYDKEMVFENKLYPGVRELLDRLHADGVQMAIASSKPIHLVEKVLEHFEIRKDFAVVVGAHIEEELDNQAGTDHKLAMVQKAIEGLRKLNGSKTAECFCKRCAMVGDRSFDIKGARANGVAAIGVSYGYGTWKELSEAGADAIAADTKELYEILRRA